MTFTPHGKHLIASQWVESEAKFSSAPASGSAHDFSAGDAALVDQAVKAAEEAFWEFGYSSREARATFLRTIADEIDKRVETIKEIGSQETGLPTARLQGETGRTTGQLRMFADHILKGEYLDRRYDAALPDRAPAPRPDLRLMQRPIGPVAVFGASNFPMAFSTAGGDTASALAAGCPVVVKGHPAHPGTGEIVADAIREAVLACKMPAGVFSFIHGNALEVGQALVQHPLIKAVGFTGSLGGGRALFKLCAERPEPIPFFGELGSINPQFLLPEAVAARGEAIGQGWAGSLTMGVGQFCTNPGIAVVLESQADVIEQATQAGLAGVGPAPMLTEGIAAAYQAGVQRIGSGTPVREVMTSSCDLRNAGPALFRVKASDWLANHALAEEVFGPLGLLVTVADADEMVALAKSFEGQLTATLHMDEGDTALGARLMPVLERKAGRVLANGFPTGVEVCDAMVHSGPYPASTNFGATSVGTMAIRRFLRPVCYQNIPTGLLPEDLA